MNVCCSRFFPGCKYVMHSDIMRLFSWKIALFGAFLTNFLFGIILWSYLDAECNCSNNLGYQRSISHKDEAGDFHKNSSTSDLSRRILFVLREFEFFDNDIIDTVSSIISVLPEAKILIIVDKTPYPPIPIYKDMKESNVRIIILRPSLGKPSSSLWPNEFLDREHVFILPDSVRIDTTLQIMKMLEHHLLEPSNIIAVPVFGERAKCLSLNVSLRQWTIKYKENENGHLCDAIEGNVVLLITRSLLLHFSHPFIAPFPDSLFIQSALRKVKVNLLRGWSFIKGKELMLDAHQKWKHDALHESRKRNLYNEFGIKKVLRPVSKVEWYGCSKTTTRCFGTVVNDMPEYLFEGRWTPPCCLDNLRQTARYVFSILEKCDVRYWLEGGSLLGAARNGDIIPWDYDVDIGIYRDDIAKCEWLKNSQKQSIIDRQGFLWEKAQEGDFIRVQFSESNHLHVDIFPFYARNGTMTKDTWFITHKQDTEFPERFLKPLDRIKFVGVFASAPNNYRNFLELKFGKGAIGNPQYPARDMLAHSKGQTQGSFL